VRAQAREAHGFARAIHDLTQIATELDKARKTGIEFGRNPDDNRATHMADVVSLMSQLGKFRSEVAPDTLAVTDAIAKAVIAKTAGDVNKGSGGLSIFVPSKKKYKAEKARYADSPGMDFWIEFLQRVYDDAAPVPVDQQPKFTNDNNAAGFEKDAEGNVIISGQLADGTWAAISEVTAYFGVYDADPPQNIIFVSDEFGGVDEDGLATCQWDTRLLQPSQGGKDATYAYASLTEQEGYYTIVVPIDYIAEPGAEVQSGSIEIVYNSNFEEQSRLMYIQQDDQWAQIEPQSGATFFTMLFYTPVPQPGVDPVEPQWKQNPTEFDATSTYEVTFPSLADDPNTVKV
jgi:hypothetical protein